MTKPTLNQWRGLNDLVTDAVEAGVTRTEQIHHAIARHPYAALQRLSPIAAPLRTIEFVQNTITGSVYWTVRLAARISGRAVSHVLERIDTRNN